MEALIKEVLEKGYLLSLATLDEKGIWASEVVYTFDEKFNIYWISKITARHSQAIIQHPQIAGVITISNKPEEKDFGLQIAGTAEKLEGIPSVATAYWQKLGNPSRASKLSEDSSWYCLKPKRIELTHQQLFGYTKKILELN